MQFKSVSYNYALDTNLSTNFKGSNIPHSDIVKNITTEMINKLIGKMSDMDIPDILYIYQYD